jgi:4-hydroxy-3-methylbut-2-enyl diphosphate reductase
VIGDEKHDEVMGIAGQLKNKAIVIDEAGNIPLGKIKKIKKACVVVQSTQNLNKVLCIIGKIQPLIPDFKFINTICRPTRLKQDEIRKMPLENDAMVVIGSKTSANTKRLFEISHSLNPHTYWIQSAEDIKPGWFKGAKNVGITAGASTPDTTTQKVIAYLQRIS